jgi:hypothetical protein
LCQEGSGTHSEAGLRGAAAARAQVVCGMHALVFERVATVHMVGVPSAECLLLMKPNFSIEKALLEP